MIEPVERKTELLNIAFKAMAGEPGERHATVQEFQSAIHEYLAHMESRSLTIRAMNSLRIAEEKKNYNVYHRALIGFEDAISLWDGNDVARKHLKRTRLLYAECAYKKDDLDLAAELLQHYDSNADLLKKVRNAQRMRRIRQARMNFMTYGLLTLMTIIIIVLWVAVHVSSRALNKYRIEEMRRRQAENNERRIKAQMLDEAKREWKLVLEEDFSNPKEITRRWSIVGENVKWMVTNGQLRVYNGMPQQLILKNATLKENLVGDLRIDFDCHQESFYLNDVSCLLGGYEFKYGGHDDARNSLMDPDRRVLFEEKESPLQRGKLYRARAEKVGNTLRYIVNGKKIFEVYDENMQLGSLRNRIGLYGFRADTWWDNIRIYKLGPPMKDDILEIADRQMEKGHYELARELYREVAETSTAVDRIEDARSGLDKANMLMQHRGELNHWRRNLKQVWKTADIELNLTMEGPVLTLRGESITKLNSLYKMPLVRLTLQQTAVKDLKPLQFMPSLTSIECQQHDIVNLAPLRNMSLLKLNVEKCGKIEDLSPLAGSRLQELNLGYCGLVRDLSPLAGLSLEYLVLHGCTNVQDISSLSNMPLTHLDLAYCSQVSDFSVLADMPLEYLDMSGCVLLDDVSILSGLPLKTCYLKDCVLLNNIRFLTNCPIQDLSLAGCRWLGETAVQGLGQMPLKMLNLQGCRNIETLNMITNCPISTLNIADTGITDVTPLAGMTVETLVFSPENVFQGIEQLRAMPALKKIGMRENELEPVEVFWERYDNSLQSPQ